MTGRDGLSIGLRRVYEPFPQGVPEDNVEAFNALREEQVFGPELFAEVVRPLLEATWLLAEN